jgi:hypothetical protein
MIAILRNGPLDGKEVKISVSTRIYSERIAGKRVVYQQTTEHDPESMKMYYDFRVPVPDEPEETSEEPDEEEDDESDD